MMFLRKSTFVPIALLAALGVLALAAFVPLPDRLTASPVAQRSFDALHLPLFALAAGAVLWFVLSLMSGKAWSASERRRKRAVVAVLVALSFVGIAALVEVVQPSTGRSASLADFIYGTIGAVLGVWWIGRRNVWRFGERGGFWCIALAAWLAVGWPVFLAGQHCRQLAKSFPQLLVGDAKVDGQFWRAGGAAEIEFLPSDSSAEGELKLSVKTRPKAWSGVTFRPSEAVANWAGRSELVLQISCADSADLPLTLGLKIEGADSRDHATRFNHSLHLDQQSQTVRVALQDIPAGVEDDGVDGIWSFDLFVHIDERELRAYAAEF